MLTGILVDGSGRRRAAAQPLTVQRGVANTVQFRGLFASGAAMPLVGGQLRMAVADVRGTLVDAVTAAIGDNGTAQFSYTPAIASGQYRYDIVYVDDAGRYGPVGAYHQLVPPSTLVCVL